MRRKDKRGEICMEDRNKNQEERIKNLRQKQKELEEIQVLVNNVENLKGKIANGNITMLQVQQMIKEFKDRRQERETDSGYDLEEVE
jgi:peptidoglycan hydrolase CwlO-like protein